MRFRKVHENLVANVIAKMSRDMRAHFHRGGLARIGERGAR